MAKPDPGEDFWALISPFTGEIRTVCHTERGYSADVTAIVDCAGGSVFVKAIHEPSPHTSSFAREAQINPHVREVSPALRWQLHQDSWIVLAFDVVLGRHSDFAPGSPDLPAVADAVNALGMIARPVVANDWTENRWDRFTDDPSLFVGNALLYTDINPDNFLVTSHGISVVDWSWPTLGAAFIDPACLVVQLIASGHSSEDAEGWAQRCIAWQSADPKTIDSFAMATLRMYRRFEKLDPAPWRQEMTKAVATWTAHRGLFGDMT